MYPLPKMDEPKRNAVVVIYFPLSLVVFFGSFYSIHVYFTSIFQFEVDKSCSANIMLITDPATPLLACANRRAFYIYMEISMHSYPKQLLSIQQQLQSYIDSGLYVDSPDFAREALDTIGYYRLRGYMFPMYDNKKKQYRSGSSLSSALKLYMFDRQLSNLLFGSLSEIEITLRARTSNAFISAYHDALVLYSPSSFSNKRNYWKNLSAIASEISRSRDVFIQHNFSNHDGQIPIWAAVEVLSFGTLSKIIKNMKTGTESAYTYLAENYKYKTANGNYTKPSLHMFSTWVHSCVILRNICAHNARIYNRALSTKPEIINLDKSSHFAKNTGVYKTILAMKYLRPSDGSWNAFADDLTNLIQQYNQSIELDAIGFPDDWKCHMNI